MTDVTLTSQHEPARLWMVRHGQTDWNVAGRIQGHTPTHLNEVGRQQAAELGRYFSAKPFKAIYASDLPRAYETAEIIGKGLGLEVVRRAGLRERALGLCEGKTTAEVADVRKSVQASGAGDLADWTGVEGVEPDEVLWQRLGAELEWISTRHAGEDVLVVSHGGVIRQMVWETLGIKRGHRRRFALSNGITLVVEIRKDGPFLLSLVDMALLVDHRVTLDTATAGTR